MLFSNALSALLVIANSIHSIHAILLLSSIALTHGPVGLERFLNPASLFTSLQSDIAILPERPVEFSQSLIIRPVCLSLSPHLLSRVARCAHEASNSNSIEPIAQQGILNGMNRFTRWLWRQSRDVAMSPRVISTCCGITSATVSPSLSLSRAFFRRCQVPASFHLFHHRMLRIILFWHYPHTTF